MVWSYTGHFLLISFSAVYEMILKPQTVLLRGNWRVHFPVVVWEPDVPNAIGRTVIRLVPLFFAGWRIASDKAFSARLKDLGFARA